MKKGQQPGMKKMTATTTRNILATALVIITLASAAGFYFGLEYIRSYAVEVSHAVTDANASGKSVDELSQLKAQLASAQTLVTKADKLFATPSTYQTQALKDVSKYAAESGVTISSIDSSQAPSGAAGSTYSEVITVQSPVSYAKFLKFLDAIEGNLPKMQITGITIGRPSDANGDQITTDKITITVSVR
jgi:hypothetical protein